ADLVGLEEEHLRDTLVGVDLRRERGRVREFERDVALPLGLERRAVDDGAATRVRALAEANDEHIARHAESFDGARESERVGGDDAYVAFEVDEGLLVEVLGIDDG